MKRRLIPPSKADPMRPITIFFPESLIKRLEHHANLLGVSRSDLVRAIVDGYAYPLPATEGA